MPRGPGEHGNPGSGLNARICPICSSEYMPYRHHQRACSLACKKKLPDIVAKKRERDTTPDAYKRKNDARRGTEYVKQENFRHALRMKYDMTPDEYYEMLDVQGGVCFICHMPASGDGHTTSRLHVDHDHKSGKVRALLCQMCNVGLGSFRDSAYLLDRAASYVELHAETPEG